MNGGVVTCYTLRLEELGWAVVMAWLGLEWIRMADLEDSRKSDFL